MAFSKTLLDLGLLCLMAMVVQGQLEGFGRRILADNKCQAVHQYDYFGGDIRKIENIYSWQHCCNLCNGERGCKGYTYRDDFKHCWLKHTLANYQFCTGCYTQAFPIPPPPKCAATYQYDYFGGDIKRVDNIYSWRHCCNLCKKEKGCKGYTWRQDFKHCWLKHTLANYQYCANCYTQKY